MLKYTSTPGIYLIKNTKNGKFYLGQTQDIKRRIRDHKSKLRCGRHPNPHLQAAWNKYGETVFKFLILEYCDVDRLDEREQHYLDIHAGKDGCYNIAIDAAAPTRGLKASSQTRQKLSEVRRGKKLPPRTEDQKRHLSEVLRGHTHTEATRAKMSKTRQGKGNNFFGKKHKPESRAKMSESARNRPPISEKTRQKLSKVHSGRQHTPEAIEKIKAKQRGVPKSDETRRKMSEAARKRPPISDETRRKLSEAQRRSRAHRKSLESDGLPEDPSI